MITWETGLSKLQWLLLLIGLLGTHLTPVWRVVNVNECHEPWTLGLRVKWMNHYATTKGSALIRVHVIIHIAHPQTKLMILKIIYVITGPIFWDQFSSIGSRPEWGMHSRNSSLNSALNKKHVSPPPPSTFDVAVVVFCSESSYSQNFHLMGSPLPSPNLMGEGVQTSIFMRNAVIKSQRAYFSLFLFLNRVGHFYPIDLPTCLYIKRLMKHNMRRCSTTNHPIIITNKPFCIV